MSSSHEPDQFMAEHKTPTFGSQPIFVLATVMSGLRCRGSSMVAGRWLILDFELVDSLISVAKSLIVYSSGLPTCRCCWMRVGWKKETQRITMSQKFVRMILGIRGKCSYRGAQEWQLIREGQIKRGFRCWWWWQWEQILWQIALMNGDDYGPILTGWE